MIELQIQMVLEGPEVWVPRPRGDPRALSRQQEATSAVSCRLINLGLVQVVPDPNHPDQMALDTRTLEYYLNRYGPRVTTARGQLGVAATRGEIWTPELRRRRRWLTDLDAWFRAFRPPPAGKVEDHRYRGNDPYRIGHDARYRSHDASGPPRLTPAS